MYVFGLFVKTCKQYTQDLRDKIFEQQTSHLEAIN